jgi:hypothetical protein
VNGGSSLSKKFVLSRNHSLVDAYFLGGWGAGSVAKWWKGRPALAHVWQRLEWLNSCISVVPALMTRENDTNALVWRRDGWHLCTVDTFQPIHDTWMGRFRRNGRILSLNEGTTEQCTTPTFDNPGAVVLSRPLFRLGFFLICAHSHLPPNIGKS